MYAWRSYAQSLCHFSHGSNMLQGLLVRTNVDADKDASDARLD